MEVLMDKADIPETFECLISMDSDTKRWIGHCLTIDLITSGATEAEAWHNLKLVVQAHVEQCIRHHLLDALGPKAPPEKWAIFDQIKAQYPDQLRRDKITITAISPKEKQSFWIQGFDFPLQSEVYGQARPKLSAVH